MQISRNIVGAALLWVSFLASHYLAYLIAFPNPVERAHELSHSGHGWLAPVSHYGVPLLIAILAVGLVSAPKYSNKKRGRLLSLNAALAFFGIEILERVMHSSMTAHSFALSYDTLLIGTVLAGIFGYIISGLFHEARVYILNSFTVLRVVIPASVKLTVPRIAGSRSHAIQDSLKSSMPHRGPPILLNSN